VLRLHHARRESESFSRDGENICGQPDTGYVYIFRSVVLRCTEWLSLWSEREREPCQRMFYVGESKAPEKGEIPPHRPSWSQDGFSAPMDLTVASIEYRVVLQKVHTASERVHFPWG
jgi:hypothetical protein